MAWTYDTGYPPADRHIGYPASVLADGTDTRLISASIESDVIGWRAAGARRGVQSASDAERPSSSDGAPADVDGRETDSGTYADRHAHLGGTAAGRDIRSVRPRERDDR